MPVGELHFTFHAYDVISNSNAEVCQLWVGMSLTYGWECLSPMGENVSHCGWECLPLAGRNVSSLKIEIHETITNPDNILLCSVDSYVCLRSNACLDWK